MRWYVRSSERRPDPPPVVTNERAPVLVGMAVWAVLLIAALVRLPQLQAQGRGWWVWTPVVALGLGLFGLRWLRGRGR